MSVASDGLTGFWGRTQWQFLSLLGGEEGIWRDGHQILGYKFSRETQSETTKHMLSTLTMVMFLNCCTKLMLNYFFLQSIYGRISDTCNSTSERGSSCSFLYPRISIPDYSTIQVEAQNADGIIESDITHWNLNTVSKCHFMFLYTFCRLKSRPKAQRCSRCI